MAVQVKVCGITNLADALAAVDAGADFLGFIFWPGSKRATTVADAKEIAAHLVALSTWPSLVGVFVNESPVEMGRILDTCGLDLAQLSGEEPASFIADQESPIFGRGFKAIRPTTLPEAEAQAKRYFPHRRSKQRPSLLLDAYHPVLRGGTGQTADWAMASVVAEQAPGMMLAGGLKPENVAAAVATVRPFAVDVASGVEASPGIKDHGKLREFLRRAKST